jgi:GxxExxY protein
MDENEISKVIVDSAIEVHRELGGPGLLESVYEAALAYELENSGLTVDRQRTVPIVYKGMQLPGSFRPDLIVNEKVIVECKATTIYSSVFEAQALTYLRLLGLKLAMVINFGHRRVSKGVHRVVNGLEESRSKREK